MCFDNPHPASQLVFSRSSTTIPRTPLGLPCKRWKRPRSMSKNTLTHQLSLHQLSDRKIRPNTRSLRSKALRKLRRETSRFQLPTNQCPINGPGTVKSQNRVEMWGPDCRPRAGLHRRSRANPRLGIAESPGELRSPTRWTGRRDR